MKNTYSFFFNDSTISENSYGHGRDDDFQEHTYLEDLWRLADKYVVKEMSNILEWGSGISTLMFADFLQQKKGTLTTLDDNYAYQQAVLKSIENRWQVNAYAADLIGPRECQSDVCLNYSSLPLHFMEKFDLIYIDGRRRIECALIAAIISHVDTVIVLHDYRRARYQPMLSLFDLVQDGPHFRVMKVKSAIFEIFSMEREKILQSCKASDFIQFRSNSGSIWISETI